MMIQKCQAIKSNRCDQMQFLRFINFLIVFLVHAGDVKLHDFTIWNMNFSAVSFFFILSGFLTGHSAYGREISVSFEAIAKNMWKKIRKFYPLHFFCTIYFVFLYQLPLMLADFQFNEDAFFLVRVLARNLLLVQSWFNQHFFLYNGVTWYLSTAFFLYLFNLPASAMLNKIGKREDSNYIFAVLIVIFTLATVLYSYISYTDNYRFWQQVFPPARLGQYFTGMILGYMLHPVKNRMLNTRKSFTIMTIFEAMALVLLFLPAFLPKYNWHNILVDVMFGNYFLISVFFLGQGAISRVFSLRHLVKLGDISLECFMIHVVVLNQLRGTPETDLGGLLCACFCLIITVMLALYLSKLQKA